MITDNQVHKLMDWHTALNVVVIMICLMASACGGGGVGGTMPSESNADSAGSENSDVNANHEFASVDQEDRGQSDCLMTSAEEEMLNQVNAARSRSWNCGATAYASVAALKWDCKLRQASLGHSLDMADNNFFSHTGSDGLGPEFRIEEQGYEAQDWGENIAAGYVNIESVMTGWLQSPGHCRNIMDPNFTDLGMTFAENQDSDYRIYWTQVFGNQTTSSPPLQVQYPKVPQGRVAGNNLFLYPVMR